jgi:hypothetical protein
MNIIRDRREVLAASAAVTTRSAAAQSQSSGLPATKPGTNTSFAPLKQIKAGVLNVGCAEAGQANGAPVILLHGWPYDIYSFVDVAPALASAGYRVIVPYIRGKAARALPAAYAKMFTGSYEHRTVSGGIGHNLPQEARRPLPKLSSTSPKADEQGCCAPRRNYGRNDHARETIIARPSHSPRSFGSRRGFQLDPGTSTNGHYKRRNPSGFLASPQQSLLLKCLYRMEMRPCQQTFAPQSACTRQRLQLAPLPRQLI